MLIVDELKQIAERVGVQATGSTIQAVINSFKAGLDAKDAGTATKAVDTLVTEEQPIIKPRSKRKSKDD